MKHQFSTFVTALTLTVYSAFAQSAPVEKSTAKMETLEVDNGSVSFTLTTNIPAIEVTGKSKSVQAHILLVQESNGISAQRIEATMPIKSLQTGMALRDEHMRKLIFTTPAGEVPDLRFESGPTNCPGAAPGHEAICRIEGSLTLRGVARPFTVPMKVRLENSGAFRAVGDGIVKLSDYGIEQPSQLGVKGSNEVKLRLDLTGKQAKQMMAASGGTLK